MNDDEMDAALTEYGDRWRSAQTAPPAVPHLRGGRRAPIVGAAAAAVLLIVGGAVVVRRAAPSVDVASRPGPTPRVIAVVPWRPAPVAQPEDIWPGNADDEVAACRRDGLTIEARFAVPPELRDATVAGLLEFTNIGDTACRVQTKLVWRPAGGRIGDVITTSELGAPAVLDPAEIAVSHLEWGSARCKASGDLSRVNVRLDELGDVTVPAFGLVRGACDAADGDDIGSGGWAVPVSGHPERQLVLTVQAPRDVRQGEVLKFRATLSNPTTRTVTLENCPVISMSVGESTEWHRLDCRATRTFPPGASVQYDLQTAAGRSQLAAVDRDQESVVVGLGKQYASARVRLLPANAAEPALVEVPWQPDPVAASDPGPGPTETAPPCVDGELEMTAYFAAPDKAARAPLGGVLEIRNTGERTCRVQSKFTFLPKGAQLPDGVGVTDELGPAAILAPGDLAVSSLSWWGAECEGTDELGRIDLIPHGNDGLAKRDIEAIGLARGACPREFGDVGSGSWAVTVTRRPDLEALRLAVSLDAPERVRAGEAVRFTATLSNPTEQPVSFGKGPCPVVSFSLGGEAVERHRLRCGAVPGRTVAPGAAVRFAFEVRAPQSVDESKGAGPMALTWGFDAMQFGGTSVPVSVVE